MSLNKTIVPSPGISYPDRNILIALFAVAIMYGMIIPIIIMDLSTRVYQLVYFNAANIPLIPSSDYISFDRWDLTKLSLIQKINCQYCSYANGIAAWTKAVVNQTELYSCAIKNHHQKNGQEHHKDFISYEEFQ